MDFKLVEEVHKNYWDKELNCSTNIILVLGKLFDIEISRQVLHGTIGLHSTTEYGGQCGLLEGLLIFVGIYGREKNYSNNEIVRHCAKLTRKFDNLFRTLSCHDLKGASKKIFESPHSCENITIDIVLLTKKYIDKNMPL